MNFIKLELVFCIQLILNLIFECSEIRLEKRVIHGINAPINEYKWAASIIADNHNTRSTYSCGATIIDRQWLITAAHCFLAKDEYGITVNLTDPKLWHARLGVRKVSHKYTERYKDRADWDMYDICQEYFQGLSKSHTEYQSKDMIHLHVEKVILYPFYKLDDQTDFDIALMKLKTPIHTKFMGWLTEKISLPYRSISPGRFPKENQNCVLVGWGCLRLNGPASEIGKLANLNIVSDRYCQYLYHSVPGLKDGYAFCAASHFPNQGLCSGDSGSGLACRLKGKWVLAGILSAGDKYNMELPTVFTKVQSFHYWIIKAMIQN